MMSYFTKGWILCQPKEFSNHRSILVTRQSTKTRYGKRFNNDKFRKGFTKDIHYMSNVVSRNFKKTNLMDSVAFGCHTEKCKIGGSEKKKKIFRKKSVLCQWLFFWKHNHINETIEDCRISSADTLEILQSCTEPCLFPIMPAHICYSSRSRWLVGNVGVRSVRAPIYISTFGRSISNRKTSLAPFVTARSHAAPQSSLTWPLCMERGMTPCKGNKISVRINTGLNNVADILQMALSIAFSWLRYIIFWLQILLLFVPKDSVGDEIALVLSQATSHYLSQCWPRSLVAIWCH